MTLAAVLAVCLLSAAYPSTGWLPPAVPGTTAPPADPQTPKPTSSNSSPPEGQASDSSQAPPAQPSSPPAPPTQESADHSADQPKPATKPPHRKKTTASNCPTVVPAPSSAESSAPSTPCPPPKKVVRNGGSDEPAVQLTGGTTAEPALHQRSTDQLMAATDGNLKKIEGRQLNPGQQEMVSQIKQFRKQSKTAAAAGDLDRAHNLALKAQLLSDELVKP
jgi:hypothetical protein